MKVIGIVGYKKSGKTTLAVKLLDELNRRGYRVASIKHTRGHIDLATTDSAKHKKYAQCAAIISSDESAIFFNEAMSLDYMLKYLDADYIVAEGFKEEKSFPRIVCLRDRKEKETLFNGLEIAALGDGVGELSIPVLKNIDKIADLVEEKSFKLPALNCGACGFDYCYDMAKEIVKGKRRLEDCVSMQPKTVIKIGGEPLPLSPFISKLIKRTIEGLLSSLKGYKADRIEIMID